MPERLESHMMPSWVQRGKEFASRRRALGITRAMMRDVLNCTPENLIRVELGLPFPGIELLQEVYLFNLNLLECAEFIH